MTSDSSRLPAPVASADSEEGAWLRERLAGWGRVGSAVPRGFEAYARVFHPAHAARPRAVAQGEEARGQEAHGQEWEEKTVRWSEVAEARGRVMHPLAQWSGLAGAIRGDVEIPGGWRVDPPREGRPEPEQLAALASAIAATGTRAGGVSADTRVVVALWEGWGELNETASGSSNDEDTTVSEVVVDARVGSRLRLPGRDYLVFATTLRSLQDPEWADRAGIGRKWGFGPMPQILWAEDRAWCVASEIDWDSTIVGGSRELVDRVLAHPELEAAEVGPGDDLSSEGDVLNR